MMYWWGCGWLSSREAPFCLLLCSPSIGHQGVHRERYVGGGVDGCLANQLPAGAENDKGTWSGGFLAFFPREGFREWIFQGPTSYVQQLLLFF